jgi:very-short-patch-repair endonuclease
VKKDFPRIHVPPEISRKMVEIAREFRKAPTKDEKILWDALRGKRLAGIKFRRQELVGYFLVDFYISVYRLVVEADGPIHETQKEVDHARQEILEEFGLVVLRGKSEVAERNLPLALDVIRKAVRYLNQNNKENSPCPFIGEGKGGD